MMRNHHSFLPHDLIAKFKGQTAVHITHTLPGCLWSTIIPFQIHPGFRKNHKQLHRFMGYIFLMTCVSSAIGFVIILQRGLLYEHFLDEQQPDHAYDDNDAMPVHVAIPIVPVFFSLILVWFLFTATMALIHAKQNNYNQHQKWFIRHISSGIWVAIQRVLIVSMLPILHSSQWCIENAKFVQRYLFTTAGFIGIFIALCVGELCIRRIDTINNNQRIRKSV